MGTLLASSLIADARRILLDPSPGATWLDADLLKYLNKGERAICEAKKETYPVRGPLTLAAGTQQVLPTNGLVLMDLFENIASGRRVRGPVDRTLQDAGAPFYPNATPEVDVQEWTKDDRDPTRFAVLPPNNGSGSVRALYGAIPTAISAVGNPINLGDNYEGALIAFVLATAYAENTTRQDLGKSGAYTNEWKGLVGVGTQSTVGTTAKVTTQGGTK